MLPIVQSQLVAQGTTFANFLAATPGCGPARASILTGQYPHNHGLRRSGDKNGGFDKFHEAGSEQSTIATWLQGAGYRTALIGKYFNEYPQDDDPTYIPPGWSEWYGVTKEGYYGFRVNENGTVRKYPRLKGYSTDIFAQQANDFIARTAPTAQPLFAYIAPRAPHNPPEPARRHEGAFADAPAPRPPSFDEADVSDKPRWVQVLPRLTADIIATTDDFYRKRLETLLAVDELVGGLIETLEASGALDNTYIFFTSDNGYHLGAYRIIKDKGAPYEESISMPLVVRGPGVLVGHTVNDLGSQVDLGATFAGWADATVPTVIDGRSLAPVLTEGDRIAPWRQVALVEKWADRPDHPPRPGKERRDTTD
jgi:arylsulfatase A-like enzyme